MIRIVGPGISVTYPAVGILSSSSKAVISQQISRKWQFSLPKNKHHYSLKVAFEWYIGLVKQNLIMVNHGK